MAHNNNHARTKEKRKKLRLKNFWNRVFDKRREKQQKANEPKGKTFTGPAKRHAIHISMLFPTGDISWNFQNHHPKDLNQRQRRKRRRQSANYRG